MLIFVSTVVVVIDVVGCAFPSTVGELLTFIIPVAVRILRRSVTVFIPFVIPTDIRTERIFFINAVIVSPRTDFLFIVFVNLLAVIVVFFMSFVIMGIMVVVFLLKV